MGYPQLPVDAQGFAIQALKPATHQKVAYTGTAGTIATPVGATLATGTILSNNTTPSDGDTITIGSVTYTFKTALTPTAGQVLINGSADAALLNLIRAINHTGTPGTDYANSGVTAVAHPQVSAATSVTSHSFLVTALATVTPSLANLIRIYWNVGTTLTGSSVALSGGLDSGPLSIIRVILTTAGYIKISAAGTAATTNDVYMPAGIPEYFACTANSFVSAIQDSAGGTLHVTEML